MHILSYPEAYAEAIAYKMDDRYTVKIFSAPYFLATKLEAYKGRGKNDGRTSTDFEDIIFVLDNRSVIWEEIAAAPASVSSYLKHEVNELLREPYIEDWVDTHASWGSPLATNRLLRELRAFAGGG